MRMRSDVADQNETPNDPIPSDLVNQDESFADLVQEFVDGLDKRTADMDALLSVGDFQALRLMAHQLKGTAGGYDYPALAELSARIEQHALDEALPACQQELDELKVMVSRAVVRPD